MSRTHLLCLLVWLTASTAWGQSTASNTVNSGATAASGNNVNTVELHSAASPPMVPMATLPSLQQPQIFGSLQRTPAGASIGVTAGYLKACAVKYTRAYQPEVRREKGASAKTKLVFAPHPQYLSLERASGAQEIEEVTPPSFASDTIANGVCLGTVTVFSEDGNATGFETVVADLSRYPFEHMKGVREVVMVAIPAGIASAGGVSSSGSSFGIGGALSHVVSMATAGAITPSFSNGGGESKPQEWIGGTFILLGIMPGGKDVRPSEFGALFNPPPTAGAGHNGAKAEAAKQ